MKINMSYKIVPLSEVVYFQEGPGLRNWQYAKEGIPFLNIRTLTDEGFINKSLCQCVKKEEFTNKYEHFLLDEGDFVVSSSGTLGKLAEVRKQDLPIMLNTSVIRFRPLDTNILDRDFLKWFIKSPLYFRQIESASTGTAIKNYGPSHLKKMVIPLPPIASQRRIANILDKADEIIRKRKEAIALTEQLQKSIFLDMFGDPVTNPKGWEIRKLGNICTIVRGGSPRPINDYLGGTIPWIKIGDATEGDDIYIHKTAEMIKEEGIKKSRYLEPNTLIFANCGVSLGFARILKIGGCIHDGWLAFSHLNSCINQIFLLKSLNQITQYFRSIAPDGTQPNLNTTIMKNFNIPVPPIDSQEKFENIIEQILKKKIKLKESLEESENLFNSLLQRAFKGEL